MPRRTPFDFNDIESEALLLVEGIDDARFFRAFLRDGLNKTNVQVAQVGGNRGFRIFLAQTLKNANNFQNLRRIVVVGDADTNAPAAFQRLRDALSNAGFPTPTRPWQTVQAEALSVAVAILPDGNSPGDLEELCLRSLIDSPALACIDEYIACIDNAGYHSRHPNKARLHTYLAAGDEPGRRLGEAADAGVWDWSSPAFTQVANFLRNL